MPWLFGLLGRAAGRGARPVSPHPRRPPVPQPVRHGDGGDCHGSHVSGCDPRPMPPGGSSAHSWACVPQAGDSAMISPRERPASRPELEGALMRFVDDDLSRGEHVFVAGLIAAHPGATSSVRAYRFTKEELTRVYDSAL